MRCLEIDRNVIIRKKEKRNKRASIVVWDRLNYLAEAEN